MNNKLKIAGLLVAVIAVVGITALISQGTVFKGVSADIGDIATGEAKLIPKADYQAVLQQLNNYFLTNDQTAQDNIIHDIVKILDNQNI